MKSPFIISTLRQYLIVLIIILTLQPSAEISAQPLSQQSRNINQVVLSKYQNVSASAATGCQWTYYPISGGKLQPEQFLFNDPDNTPIVNLSLGNMFKGKATHLNTTGSTDFNGDNKTDIFRTIPRLDGNLQWQYSSGSTGAWQNLAYAGPDLPISQL